MAARVDSEKAATLEARQADCVRAGAIVYDCPQYGTRTEYPASDGVARWFDRLTGGGTRILRWPRVCQSADELTAVGNETALVVDSHPAWVDVTAAA